MAFSAFANGSSGFGNLGASSNHAATVSELAEISTEAIGFHALAGESKVRLLPKWPSDALPPPTSSLLSIANSKGLLAAAGPDAVVIASTEAVRQTFNASGDDKFKSFNPQLMLNLGVRISQVAFSANEDFLVLSAETGGGLAIYEVSSLMQGNTQPAFEVTTNGTALRSLLPNPKPETAEFVAVVTVNGQLMIADLKSKQFISGAQGQILRDNVSTASWSNKGKQIVAGLGNGGCVQMTPDGQVKAEISAPPGLNGDQMVSSLTWLENDIFLTAHTPSITENSGMIPPSSYHIINREKASQNSFSFRKLPELSSPFGLPRTPAFQFVSRLRQYPPSLDDVIAVISTGSADVSVVTRSKTALSNELPDDQTVNTYTSTLMADDAKRASLPMTEAMSDSSPIGMAFDLSSKEKVKKPLPGEEFENSPYPLPALLVLSNEGILSAWWFVYAESIRQGTAYPGLTAAGELPSQQGAVQQTPSPSKPAQSLGSAFGQVGFGSTSTPSGPFGAPPVNSGKSAFGSSNTTGSAFGAPSGLGAKTSPWSTSTTTPNTGTTFGQPSFGAPSKLGAPHQSSAFGSTSGLGNKPSPWASTSTTPAASGASFGQTGKLGSTGSVFGAAPSASGTPSNSAAAPATGGFASFANTNAFAAAPSSGSNLFGKPALSTPFVSKTESSVFGQPSDSQKGNPFNKGAFKLGSTFQNDGSAASDKLGDSNKSASSLFGGKFGAALGEAAATPLNDADMTDGQENPAAEASKDAPTKETSTTDPGTQSFGEPSAQSGGSSKPSENTTTGFTFGSTAPDAKTKDTSSAATQPAVPQKSSPKVKKEPRSDSSLSDSASISSLNDDEARPPQDFDANNSRDADQAETPETPLRSPSSPLPPESTSKTAYAAGDSSSSSKTSDDAPLPPDFVSTKANEVKEPEVPQVDQADTPHDSQEENESFDRGDEDAEHSGTLDDEGSGVDVGQELSPASSKNSTKITPESSFGAARSKGTDDNLFSPQQATTPSTKPPQAGSLFGNLPLFGESGKPSIPLFANQKSSESPRSPSPVRREQDLDALRPDNFRSVTAPNNLSGQKEVTAQNSSQKRPTDPPMSTKQMRDQEMSALAEARSNRALPQSQTLSDDEDEQNRRILSTEVAPSRTLDRFIAHQNYVSDKVKPGIPGQIEQVFRDINSMIDTLGLNARSLVAFTEGHENTSPSIRQGGKDLDRLDDWCLVDVAELTFQEDDLQTRLHEQKIQNTPEKLAEVQSIRQSFANTKRQQSEISRALNNSKNPPTSQANAQKPLDLDQQTLLKDLRKEFANFQKQLSEAEQSLVLLRTKLSSQSDSGRSNGKSKLKQPTVEAVENTIRKMTNLISQKSEDLDDLSLKLGDLRMDSPSGSSVLAEPNFRTSRQGTPSGSSSFFNAPQRGDRSSARRGKYDPHSSVNGHKQSPLRASQSTNGGAAGAVDFLTPEERRVYRQRAKTRQEINDVVKEVFGGSQVKVVPLD